MGAAKETKLLPEKQALREACQLLKDQYAPLGGWKTAATMETIMGAVLALNDPLPVGLAAGERLMRCFVDWNHVRVAWKSEIAAALAPDAKAAERAEQGRLFLRRFFQVRGDLDPSFLRSQKITDAKKFLQATDCLERPTAEAILLLYCNHSNMPMDDSMWRVLSRLGWLASGMTRHQAAREIEQSLDKNEYAAFFLSLHQLAHTACTEDDPSCGRCALKTACAFPRRR